MPSMPDKRQTFLQWLRQRAALISTLPGMKQPEGNQYPAIHSMLISQIRRSPGLRSVAYLGVCFGLPYFVPSPWAGRDVWSRTANYVSGAVVLGSVTWMFSILLEENSVTWNRVLQRQQIRHCAVGVGLGAGAFGAVIGIARSFGWIDLPTWGWEQATAQEITSTMMLLAFQHAAVASSEELVFRGYGLHTLRQAVDMPAAASTLTILFTLAHGITPQRLLGQGALGMALMMLRLCSGSVALPLGYHFAWNYIQTGIFGPVEWPSLRPLHIQGPYQWVGRPGHPEPGLLTTAVNLSVAAGAGLVWWHRRRNN